MTAASRYFLEKRTTQVMEREIMIRKRIGFTCPRNRGGNYQTLNIYTTNSDTPKTISIFFLFKFNLPHSEFTISTLTFIFFTQIIKLSRYINYK